MLKVFKCFSYYAFMGHLHPKKFICKVHYSKLLPDVTYFYVFLILCFHGPFTPKEVDTQSVHDCKLLQDVI